MRRIKARFPYFPNWKTKILNWANQSDFYSFLDSSEKIDEHGRFNAILACGKLKELKSSKSSLEGLKMFRKEIQDWCFGYLAYDLKNEIHPLTSKNENKHEIPNLHFFQPEKLILFEKDEIVFSYPENLEDQIISDYSYLKNSLLSKEDMSNENYQALILEPEISKQTYIMEVNKLKKHIHRGDIYEANYCQNFSAYGKIDPVHSYLNLQLISEAPFSALSRFNETILISSSPERFLQKQGSKLISQPIKGTAKRDPDPRKDRRNKTVLEQDLKERSENIMIVDLVRNDLSLIAKKGSVKVTELCKVYSFKQVHQMISTIEAELQNGLEIEDILKALFPMGSMTGAPKLRAMQLIDKTEHFYRGLYSGAMGYISPEEDFDFNVVIRSIVYLPERNSISVGVGSAITHLAEAEKEYEECLLKAAALKQILA